MCDFATEFSIPVALLFAFADIAEHAERLEVLAAEALPVEELATLAFRNVSKAPQSVDGGLVTHTEVMREQGVVLVGDALRACWRALFGFNMAAGSGIEDGVVLAARHALVEVPQGSTDSTSRHEKGGGECVGAFLDHFGRVVGAGDSDLAVSIQQGVCVFVRVGKALPSFRMERVHENSQPDAGMSQE